MVNKLIDNSDMSDKNQFLQLSKNIPDYKSNSRKQDKFDLLIIDDVFPSLKSGFRYVEFTTYLNEFNNSLILTSGKNIAALEKKPITDVIGSYREKFPNLSHKVIQCVDKFPLNISNLVYVTFLNNAFSLLPQIEAAKVPFVFTLYPGGGFLLNDQICDRKLKRVFNSPCFQKVIVTQQVTYNYIISRGMCPPEKVQMIFGVVMPELPKVDSLFMKNRWGFDKSRLDICFMAHKYTTYGQDKGYDVFVSVATILRQYHEDIYFHVVGPFDPKVIDVSSLSDRIEFHGSLDPEKFDSFFQNIDIIISPNISGKICPGSFDGFPTASCTEAALRGSAIFAVDEFNSAEGYFTDGEDIVLIQYNIMDIVDKIENYYANPYALKRIGENGMHRVRELYNLEAQMKPRIDLLREVMHSPIPSENINWKILKLNVQWKLSFVLDLLRKIRLKSITKDHRS